MRTNYMGFAEVRGRIALKLMTLGKDLEGEGVYRSMQEEEKKKDYTPTRYPSTSSMASASL